MYKSSTSPRDYEGLSIGFAHEKTSRAENSIANRQVNIDKIPVRIF